MAASRVQKADDPSPRGKSAANAPLLVAQTTAVAHKRATGLRSNDLSERGDAILVGQTIPPKSKSFRTIIAKLRL